MTRLRPARRARIGLTAWKRPVRTMVGDPEQLFTLAEAYVDEVRRAGGLPLILPPGPLAAAGATVRGLDGLVLTGGGDFCPSSYGEADHGRSSDMDPEQDAWDLALARAARRLRVPFFGICRGMQALNVALGGTLEQDIAGRGDHPPISPIAIEAAAFRHLVRIEPRSRLGRVLGLTERRVNSIHHQAVGRLGEGLVPVAHAPDGTVEGVEYRARSEREAWSAFAVQWHPERMEPGPDQLLFDDFIRVAMAHRAASKGV